MAGRVIWSLGKMYISSNWILAKALRMALSMVRGREGLDRAKGWDSSHSQASSHHCRPWELLVCPGVGVASLRM